METLTETLPRVSVVIIGRNEAGNIAECIASALGMDYPQDLLEVIYVDTGSTDGTQDIARAAGVRVIEVSSQAPSAALARNTGLWESKHKVVHFIDGDMTIDPAYLKKAVSRLSEPETACVIGRVVERHADTNWVSRMLNIDWKTKEEGHIGAPGGGGTFIKSAIENIGGYNSGLTMAEETDLGIRMRAAGYGIYLIDGTMAVHDYGVHGLWELIKRFHSSGRGQFKILVSDNVAPEVRRWAWSLPKQAAAATAAASVLMFSGYKYVVLALLLAYPVVYMPRVLFADWKNIVTRRLGLSAFLYTYTFGVMKPVVLLGMIRESAAYFLRGRKKGMASGPPVIVSKS